MCFLLHKEEACFDVMYVSFSCEEVWEERALSMAGNERREKDRHDITVYILYTQLFP